ncbi:MAG: flagellar export chaperone FlgN [Lachnospiraceae bacterium]|nr:flagellar export chaperone FlgN [Lachnospiraceae bacterium]
MNNTNNITYINILNDTLKKKEEVLRDLTEATDAQSVLLDQPELDIDKFNELVDEKEKLLQKLESLDEGFLGLYEKVRIALAEDASAYADQVKETQQLVRTQTELSTSLQAAEERNKAKMTVHLARGHQKIKEFRVSSQTAAAYYKNMSGKHQDGDSYFFNRKK